MKWNNILTDQRGEAWKKKSVASVVRKEGVWSECKVRLSRCRTLFRRKLPGVSSRLGGILYSPAGPLSSLSRTFAEMFPRTVDVFAKMLPATRDPTVLNVGAETGAGLACLFSALFHLSLDRRVAVRGGLLIQSE